MLTTKNLETCHQIPRAALDTLLSVALRHYKHIQLQYMYHLSPPPPPPPQNTFAVKKGASKKLQVTEKKNSSAIEKVLTGN